MYTYLRLRSLLRENNSDGEIARYILMHTNSLDSLTVSQFVNETGISKSSLNRFYSKGGYISFKNLLNSLNEEIAQKKLNHTDFSHYKETSLNILEHVRFDRKVIKYFIDKIKVANKVVFYGNTTEIACLEELQLYLHVHQKDVIYLDRWDIGECYEILDQLNENDVFIMIETSWHIQMMYENSIVHQNILNLDIINELNFEKIYIGQADSFQYLSFHNIQIDYPEYSHLLLDFLDKKIGRLL